MLRVLTLSTLFPDVSRPNFGIFVEQQTQGLAARRDVEVQVVAPLGLPPAPFRCLRHHALARLPRREIWRGLDVHRPRFRSIGGRWQVGHLTRALVPLLDEIARTFPFDVIDASFFFPDGPAAVALGRRYGVPVSIKARGADIHRWGRLPSTGLQVLAAGLAADGMLAVSAAMRADMVALGMPAQRIAVHHTGVDQERFHPVDRTAARRALGLPGPLVASVGALIARKGHDVVIEAIAALPGVSLVIAGQGADERRLRERATALGVADRVRFAGAVPHGELPALLAAADVMALASSSEGLANAWVEALACGTPIVVTDVGGAHDVVTSAEAGRIVPRNALAFAGAIAGLLVSPPDPALTRAAAARFRWEANSAQLEDHLCGLIDRRHGMSVAI